jgi:hypothetical protein
MRKRLILGAVLASVLAFGTLAFGETDYPSKRLLERVINRLDAITATLADLEAAVALIPTAS